MHVLVRGLLDLLYPPRCEACGGLRRDPICPECLAAITPITPPLCEICGEPFDPQAAGAPRCAACRSPRGRAFAAARSAVYYDGPVVPLIWRYKYDGQMALGEPLGRLMAEALAAGASDLGADSVDVVCAVPLHRTRLRERGFNQSELLAESVAAALSRPLEPLLQRTRPTRPQVDVPREVRASNVRGAFAAAPDQALTGRRVLLVDDLFTTGATLAECARALRRGGADEVRVLTLARPLPAWRRVAADIREAQAQP